MITDTKSQPSDFKLGQNLFRFMRYKILKKFQQKVQASLNLIADWMQRCFDHIFAYYDLLLPIGSDEIIEKLQIWLNNPQCGHQKGPKFSNFLVR